MKSIKYSLLFIWLLASIAAISQSKNPYKSIGKKSQTLSLTKGKYEEFFDQDSIQQVGSVLMNVRTMKVVKLLEEKDAKERLENEKGSRFLSVDPITADYPELTPYQFASNTPIQAIDLDGLEAAKINPVTGDAVPIGPMIIKNPGKDRDANGWILFYPVNVQAKANKTALEMPSTRNIAASTACNTCEAAKRMANDKRIVPLTPKSPSFTQGYTSLKGTEKGDPYTTTIIPNYVRAEQSERAGDGFPLVGPLVQGARRLLYGDNSGAVSSFKNFGKDLVISIIPSLRISGNGFFEGASYSSKVLAQMSKADDIYHAFPTSMDAFATKFGQWSVKMGADGKPYQWLKMAGSLGGKTGVFEYTKDANGIINHRFFNVAKTP